MADFLRWALGGFWRFVGLFLLIGVVLDGIAKILRSFAFPPEPLVLCNCGHDAEDHDKTGCSECLCPSFRALPVSQRSEGSNQ